MSGGILDAVMRAAAATLRGMAIEQAGEIERLVRRLATLDAEVARGIAERETLRRERDEAYAALRDRGFECSRCGKTATRFCVNCCDYEHSRVCDGCNVCFNCGRGDVQLVDNDHAATIRVAAEQDAARRGAYDNARRDVRADAESGADR